MVLISWIFIPEFLKIPGILLSIPEKGFFSFLSLFLLWLLGLRNVFAAGPIYAQSSVVKIESIYFCIHGSHKRFAYLAVCTLHLLELTKSRIIMYQNNFWISKVNFFWTWTNTSMLNNTRRTIQWMSSDPPLRDITASFILYRQGTIALLVLRHEKYKHHCIIYNFEDKAL